MMDVYITVDDSYDYSVSDEMRSMVAAAALAALRHETTSTGELTVLLTGDEMLAALNQAHRGMLGTTDVLAFPAGDMPEIPDLNHYYGDIAISLPRAKAQSAARGHSMYDELQLLVVHGVLHLLGHDHTTPDQKMRMWSVQSAILTQLGIDSHIAD
jgi:probable rRNA maturation factor